MLKAHVHSLNNKALEVGFIKLDESIGLGTFDPAHGVELCINTPAFVSTLKMTLQKLANLSVAAQEVSKDDKETQERLANEAASAIVNFGAICVIAALHTEKRDDGAVEIDENDIEGNRKMYDEAQKAIKAEAAAASTKEAITATQPVKVSSRPVDRSLN